MMPSGIPGQLGDDIAASDVAGIWVGRGDIGDAPGGKGAYVLALGLAEAIEIKRSHSKPGKLNAGWYLYLGSAWGSGGMRPRVGRHFKSAKKVHWHIDRLTIKAADMAALFVAEQHECDLVAKLLGSRRFKIAAEGFGSTDCRRCESHLLASVVL